MSLSEKFSNALTYILLSYLLYTLFIQHKETPKNIAMGVKEQVELKEPGLALNVSGQVSEAGWSKKYIKEFNHEKIYPVWFGLNIFKNLRTKKFEFHSVAFDDKIFTVVVADVHYGAHAFVSVYDFNDKSVFLEHSKLFPIIDSKLFPNMGLNPFSCLNSEYTFHKKNFTVIVKHELQPSTNICKISLFVEIDNRLKADFQIHRNESEENNFDILPLYENNRYFLYNLKSNANPCTGILELYGKKTRAERDSCLGMMDYGRGVFLYKHNWIWVTASGILPDQTRISINLGGGVSKSPTAKSVDDFIKVNGKVYHLNPVIPVYDRLNLMNPMTFRTSNSFDDNINYADVVFTPNKVFDISENLFVISSHMTYVYGTFSGRVVDDHGNETKFEDIQGLAEFAKFKW